MTDKDAYYFSHDSNSRKDPKCLALINDFGLEGYGLYWVLIEIMHEQNGGRIEKFPKLYDGLAFEMNMEKEALAKQIEAMLHDYNLLQEDEFYIWSDRVLRNLEIRKEKRLVKAQAGRAGGLKSGISRRYKLQTKQIEAPLEANEQKERKGKERKEKIKRFVPPSLNEVKEYIAERKSSVDPKTFLDYFTTGNWIDSKGNKVKNWKQKLITWESNNLGNSNSTKQELIINGPSMADIEKRKQQKTVTPATTENVKRHIQDMRDSVNPPIVTLAPRVQKG